MMRFDDFSAFPCDLAEDLGAVRLTRLALEAVQGGEPMPGEFRSGPGRESHQYRMLLTLLSYAYARGIYGSEEIQDRVHSDADLRYLCAFEFPDADTLRHFRRREGKRLNQALVRLFDRAMEGGGASAAEAARRMEQATVADSLALDC